MRIKTHAELLDADMVPFIDIVTLLLLFLIVVGDMATKVNTVTMRLPSADQAVLNVTNDKRIVVQVHQDEHGKYWAVVENRKYEIAPRGAGSSLLRYLDDQVQKRVADGSATKDLQGEVDFPVKLRIPVHAPMEEVERVLLILARAGLVKIHFAAEPEHAGRRR